MFASTLVYGILILRALRVFASLLRLSDFPQRFRCPAPKNGQAIPNLFCERKYRQTGKSTQCLLIL